MSIIIVGNGTSLLDSENGNLIDSYDVVLRFNMFEIAGYEKYVGTKTDIWYSVIGLNKKSFRASIPYSKIYWMSWEWNVDSDKKYQEYCEFFKEKNIYVEKVSKEVQDEIVDYFELKKYKSFSSGIFGIWTMLKLYKNVTITGFDWWHRQLHHYSDNYPRGHMHNPSIEFSMINKLILENKVKFL